VHADVEAAWERVVESWDDPARHDALVGLVAQHSAFAWAASKYKERAGDAIADKQLERIRKAATATMFATASRKQTEETPYRRTMVIFIVLLLMMVLGLLGVKMVHDSRTQDAPPPRPPITKPAHP
jgi:hypothetical protein